MKTALFAWELGSNLGHASPMAEIARTLSDDGVRIAVAGRELESLGIAFAELDAIQLQAPVWAHHHHYGNEETQASFLDILVNAGFGDPAKLAVVVNAWRALITLIRPDVIVSDHSPGLLVATYGGDIPVVSIGTGYTMPPLDRDRFPPMRPDRSPIANEAQILASATPILRGVDAAPPQNLVDLFRATDRIVFSFPELDPYRVFRTEPLCLPPETLPSFTRPPLEPRLFVYLGVEMQGLEAVVQALAEFDAPAIVYLRGDLGPLSEFLAMRGHEVHRTPPKLAKVLPRVSHIISAGGSFTCHAAFAAGRPHLVIPLHRESKTNLGLLEALGVGQQLAASANAEKVVPLINAFVHDDQLVQNAQHWAGVVAGRAQPKGADAVRAAILRYLAL